MSCSNVCYHRGPLAHVYSASMLDNLCQRGCRQEQTTVLRNAQCTRHVAQRVPVAGTIQYLLKPATATAGALHTTHGGTEAACFAGCRGRSDCAHAEFAHGACTLYSSAVVCAPRPAAAGTAIFVRDLAHTRRVLESATAQTGRIYKSHREPYAALQKEAAAAHTDLVAKKATLSANHCEDLRRSLNGLATALNALADAALSYLESQACNIVDDAFEVAKTAAQAAVVEMFPAAAAWARQPFCTELPGGEESTLKTFCKDVFQKDNLRECTEAIVENVNKVVHKLQKVPGLKQMKAVRIAGEAANVGEYIIKKMLMGYCGEFGKIVVEMLEDVLMCNLTLFGKQCGAEIGVPNTVCQAFHF